MLSGVIRDIEFARTALNEACALESKASADIPRRSVDNVKITRF
jgi:hypothetical protein